MAQAIAARYCAEQKGGGAWIDIVLVTTMRGSFQMGYDEFHELFGLEIPKNDEIPFEVDATKIPSEECQIPR
jgi:hypothetical protein